jgi:tripartite-type tricarboxylate transporter receptor subunit TctC
MRVEFGLSCYCGYCTAANADWTFVAFDMSQQRLMWFVRVLPRIDVLLGEPMLLTRREAITGCGGGLALLMGSPALAQTAYPSRTIKMIVPYPAGGTTDFLGRLVADQLKTGLGATVIVENKPGAATALGAEQVARAEPDGYTLLMATSTTLAINKTLYKKLPYDPVKDFTPIALVAAVPFALIINPQIPAKTLREFIAYAKSKPGLAYGSAGNGSPQHLGAEMLKTAAGIDIRHVPYRGSVPAMLDVIAGHIPFMVVDLQPAMQQIREGTVRVLGVTTAKRVAAAPEIPTLAEGGLAGFELVAWQGVVAPAGVPRAIVDQLAGQIGKLVADPATRYKLTTITQESWGGSTPDSFAAYVRTEVDRWADIVKNSGAELE